MPTDKNIMMKQAENINSLPKLEYHMNYLFPNTNGVLKDKDIIRQLREQKKIYIPLIKKTGAEFYYTAYETDLNGNVIGLALHDKKLTKIPESIFQLQHLKVLSLQSNHLTALPTEIEDLKKLTVLNLENNYFASFPDEILKLKNLTILNLSDNELEYLPDGNGNRNGIGQLKNLRQLDLSGNQLEYIPYNIQGLNNLTVLNLSNNELKSPIIREEKQEKSNETGQFNNLTELNLSGNQLKSIPSEIQNYTNLAVLDISDNELTAIDPLFGSDSQQNPDKSGQLKNLTELDLSGNRLKSIPSEIKVLNNLSILDLSNNELESLAQDVKELKNLKELNLADNNLNLDYFPDEIFELEKLKEVDLSGNKLKYLLFTNEKFIAFKKRFKILRISNLKDNPNTETLLKTRIAFNKHKRCSKNKSASSGNKSIKTIIGTFFKRLFHKKNRTNMS
jgi:Leucine-rich repeat (LRR) protein